MPRFHSFSVQRVFITPLLCASHLAIGAYILVGGTKKQTDKGPLKKGCFRSKPSAQGEQERGDLSTQSEGSGGGLVSRQGEPVYRPGGKRALVFLRS